MKFYYVILEKSEKLPKNTEYVSSNFYRDYQIHYSPKYFNIFESIFTDVLYQMILNSHLIKDNRMASFEKPQKINESVFDGESLIDIPVEKKIRINAYREYMQNDFTENCRMSAKDIFHMFMNRETKPLDLFKKLKLTETDFEYERNILQYENVINKFYEYVHYDTSNSVVIYSNKNISDWLQYHNIRFVLF